MAPRTTKGEVMAVTDKKEAAVNKGTWTTEEDGKLAEIISVHGAKRWKSIAVKAGLNRCGKSCRLRWLNYLRPNIKRGNISDQEEDLIIRLHKLLGNRWSLIAGRLPGRTDNEIKNYWNSHLSKKINQKHKQNGVSSRESSQAEKRTESNVDLDKSLTREHNTESVNNGSCVQTNTDSSSNFNADDFFDFSDEDPLKLDWISQFIEMDHHHV